MKDHEIAKLVNDLCDVARQFHGAQQLRERIRHVIVDPLKAAQELERLNADLITGGRVAMIDCGKRIVQLERDLECEKIESQTLRHGLRLAERRREELENSIAAKRIEAYQDGLHHAAFYVRDHLKDGEEHFEIIEDLKIPPQYAAKGAA